MSDLFRMMGAPVDVEVNGKTWQFSPLTMGDLGKLDEWAEQQIFADLKKRIALLPPEAKEAKQKLFDRIALITERELSEEAQAVLISPRAAVQRALLMLKRKHPEITEKETEDLLGVVDFKEILMRVEGSSGNMNTDLLIAVKRVVSAKVDGKEMEKAEKSLTDTIERYVKEIKELRRPFAD